MEDRSVEKGMRILPPFSTPVGLVGMTICFDVSSVSPSSTTKRQVQISSIAAIS